jgi:hypothetical protein
MKELFTTSKNGVEVYVDTEASHASTHFAHSPMLREFAQKFVSEIGVEGDLIRLDKDMGEVVGMTDLIETSEGDDIVYAMRPLRSAYSRFVKNKQPAPTNWVTIDIRKKGNDYFLYTAFVGRLTPSFPGGEYLPEQSREFWSKHALALDSQDIVPGTETTKCPW